jgi:hypothetical protein
MVASPVPTNRLSQAFTTDTTSHVIDLSTVTFTPGGLCLIIFANDNGPGVTTTLANYQTMLSDPNAGNAPGTKIFARKCDGSEGASVDVVTSGIERAAAVAYYFPRNQWRGSDLTALTDAIYVSSVSTTVDDPPNLAPGIGSKQFWWLAIGSGNAGTTVSVAPTNYTNLLVPDSASGTTGAMIAVGERGLTAASENPGVFTTPSGSIARLWTLALAPFEPSLPPFYRPMRFWPRRGRI